MDIMSVLVTLIIFGVLIYIVTLIPMNSIVKQIIVAIAILAVMLWLAQVFGIYHFGYISHH